MHRDSFSTEIVCFGVAREIAGGSSLHLELSPGTTAAELKQKLIETYPAFGELVDFAIARNEAYATPDEVIEVSDELVIIPPVSGG